MSAANDNAKALYTADPFTPAEVAVWDKIIASQAAYYNLTPPLFARFMSKMATLCEQHSDERA